MGADFVIDRANIAANVLQVAPDGTDCIFTPHSTGNIEAFAAIAKPFSDITTINGPPAWT